MFLGRVKLSRNGLVVHGSCRQGGPTDCECIILQMQDASFFVLRLLLLEPAAGVTQEEGHICV